MNSLTCSNGFSAGLEKNGFGATRLGGCHHGITSCWGEPKWCLLLFQTSRTAKFSFLACLLYCLVGTATSNYALQKMRSPSWHGGVDGSSRSNDVLFQSFIIQLIILTSHIIQACCVGQHGGPWRAKHPPAKIVARWVCCCSASALKDSFLASP